MGKQDTGKGKPAMNQKQDPKQVAGFTENYPPNELEIDETTDTRGFDATQTRQRRLGGPTGGDLAGGGGGPVIGETHPADEQTADHYGSREETQAALEEKIATQNTLRLHERF